jgi:hypothetical protein
VNDIDHETYLDRLETSAINIKQAFHVRCVEIDSYKLNNNVLKVSYICPICKKAAFYEWEYKNIQGVCDFFQKKRSCNCFLWETAKAKDGYLKNPNTPVSYSGAEVSFVDLSKRRARNLTPHYGNVTP